MHGLEKTAGSKVSSARADALALFARGFGLGAATCCGTSSCAIGWCTGHLYHTNPHEHLQLRPTKPFLQPLHQTSLLGLYNEKGAAAGLVWPAMQTKLCGSVIGTAHGMCDRWGSSLTMLASWWICGKHLNVQKPKNFRVFSRSVPAV